MHRRIMFVPVLALLASVMFCGSSLRASETGYYKEDPLFHYYPAEDAPRWTIGRLGPIGLSVHLLQPAFTMQIAGIEPGSPAAATGQLRAGQFVESINGNVLKDIDPRVLLGNWITEAEAKDGEIVLMVKEDRDAVAFPVTVQIPALGAYSETWPENCAKSDAIVRDFADYLSTRTPGWGAALFLLSTGEEQDLEVVHGWFSNLNPDQVGFPWSIGYDDIALAEYYLRTGDETVLPIMQRKADYLKRTLYNGSWMGRGSANFRYMAGGHMNAAAAHSITFLLMAKECGVDVDEHTLQSSLAHFFRYVGRGNVPYGDAFPEGGYTDNGRVAKLGFAMQAAANLMPDGENSVYAKAAEISATKSFYATSWLFHGHTGGGIGEFWRGPAMGMLRETRPLQYRSFMNERRWMYELARTHEGAFGWADGQNVNYTAVNNNRPNGNYIPLIFTQHRQQLRIFGAPPTKFSKTYALPERPWGTAGDDVFYSLEAGQVEPGVGLDVSRETIRNGASRAIGRRLDDRDTSDEMILQYALHIDQTIRDAAVQRLRDRGRIDMLNSLLQSDDPRGRHAGARGLGGLNQSLTDEMVALLGAMVGDPGESWWVVQEAMQTLGRRATADQLAPYLDTMDGWLDNWDWWMQSAAIDGLAPLAADKRFCERLLPRIGAVISRNQSPGLNPAMVRLVNRVRDADQEVLELGLQTMANAYAAFPETLSAPGGQDMSQGTQYMLDQIASALVSKMGGFDVLFRIAQERFPDQMLPHLDLYLTADTERFGSELREAFKPIIRDHVIWRYVGDHLVALEREIERAQPDRAVNGLVNLYQRIGVTDYDWGLWGPRRDKIEWQYVSYDPPEKLLWERGGERGGRYRPVSWPQGAEEWMQPGFDAAAAGWRTGLAPFAHNDGKLAPVGGCVGEHHFCGCGNPPHTFWENEVLLMRTKLDLPVMRDGYAYRLLVGGRSHVGSGEGSDVWINGTRKEGRRREDPTLWGVGRRVGGQPWGFTIDDAFRAKFTGETVTVAATGFLPIHRSGVKRNYQAFWFETMQLPALGEAEVLRVLRVTPLLTSAWQASLDESDAYRFDGSLIHNPSILGRWQKVGTVANISDYEHGVRLRVDRNARFYEIAFLPDGRTDDFKMMYSGDMLLDVVSKQAFKMSVKTLDDTEYLFIEAGGFSEENMGDWQTSYYVLRRTGG